MKKILLAAILLCLFGVFWYLFIKQYDYQFKTTAKYNPGTVYHELAEWQGFSDKYSIRTIEGEPFSNLVQRIKLDSSYYIELEWELVQQDDSLTALSLNVASNKNQLTNRWEILNPFQKSTFIDTLKRNLLSFKKDLQNQQEVYRITSEKEIVETPHKLCACSASRNIPINKKADEMIATISRLENYFLKKNLELNGYPFVKITRWDRKANIIDFKFCFPVSDSLQLKETSLVSLEEYPSQKALMTKFNGNYRLSHFAWFELLFEARKRGIETSGLPLEIFYDNPMVDINDAQWRADVYLPIAEN